MTHGSLFTGIGGIDLGFEWAGIETKWQVEIDNYCQELLSVRFPHTEKFTDVRKVGSHNLEKVDIISGGFPCQDISVAGKGAGIEGERSGLWTELHRVISELRPRFAFIENVPMLTIRGGTRVIADLAEIGYDAEWQIVGADDVGAWHRRKRIWIVAYTKCDDGTNGIGTSSRKIEKRNYDTKKWTQNSNQFGGSSKMSEPISEDVSHSEHNGPSTTDGQREKIESPKPTGKKGVGEFERRGDLQDAPNTDSSRRRERWRSVPIQEKFDTSERSSKRTVPPYWAVEPNVGRVAHGISKRVDRLKGLGNAVVPQIPYIIGKRLKELCQENQAEKH